MVVIASIHQPRFAAYQMFDRLLLLRQGELVYGGDAGERATDYFDAMGFHLPQSVNPADYFIEVCFGLQHSVKQPPTTVDDLSDLWRAEYAKLLQEEEEERKQQGAAPAGLAAFTAWFTTHRLYHTLAASLAEDVYSSVEAGSGSALPTWAALHAALAHWRMPRPNMPTWFAQFSICLHRYLLKRLRLRKRLSLQLASMIVLSIAPGLGQGPETPRTAIMLVGTIALFCTYITTCSIESVLQGDSSALFEHESASGVRQSAEIAARILGDLLIWMPAPLLYGMPYLGLANFRGGEERLRFFGILYMLAFAMQPFAYIATLLSRANAVILVSSVSMVLSIFLSGHVGVNLRDSPTLLGLSPPAWALHAFCLVFLSSLPFDQSRAAFSGFLVRQNVLLLPFNSTMGDLRSQVAHMHSPQLLGQLARCHEERAAYGITPYYNGSSLEGGFLEELESGGLLADSWYGDDLMALILFGLILRVVTVILFVYQTARDGSLLPAPLSRPCARRKEAEATPASPAARMVRGTIIKSSRFSVNTLRLNKTVGVNDEAVGFTSKDDLDLGVSISFAQRISRIPLPPSEERDAQPPPWGGFGRITEETSAEALARSMTPRDND